MSTLAISVKALASVRETMRASYFWQTNNDDTPLCFWHSFMGNFSTFSSSEKATLEKANDFVRLAFIFNAEEYHKGKFAEINASPIEYGNFLNAVANCQPKRLDVFQLLTTLQMIAYNTCSRGWMTNETYKNWAYREEYEKFHATIEKMISSLAQHIVDTLPQKQLTKWCLE